MARPQCDTPLVCFGPTHSEPNNEVFFHLVPHFHKCSPGVVTANWEQWGFLLRKFCHFVDKYKGNFWLNAFWIIIFRNENFKILNQLFLLKFGKIHQVFLHHKIPKKEREKPWYLESIFMGKFCGTFPVVIIVNMNFCRREGAAQERIFWQILLIYSAQSNFSSPGL
jgi:hypothetical protein